MSRDPFRGSDADLIDSINALIGLNAADALTPRIPRMAIDLLTSAAIRFAPGPAASTTLASGTEQVTAQVERDKSRETHNNSSSNTEG